MTVKRKDFQKTATYIHEFLLKLQAELECAELRDALNLALLHMQKYYCHLQTRLHNQGNKQNGAISPFGTSSLRGLSPMTPYRDSPDKWQWEWISLEHPSHRLSRSLTLAQEHGVAIGVPIVHQAAKAGDLDALEQIYKTHASTLNSVDGLGRTPLMYAVHYARTNAIQWLLEHKADPNVKANDNSTALHRACHNGNAPAVELLLDYRVATSKQDVFGRAPVHWAVTTPSTHCLKLLVQHGVNVNLRDMDGLSPKMWACRLDNIDHLSILNKVKNQKIEEPDGIERDLCGRTWIHWAVRRTEPLQCLKSLLADSTVVLRDDEGKTVMLYAAEQGSLPACKLIVEMGGADVIHDRDDQNRSSLHLATVGGHGEVVNFLLEKGADIECQDKHNASPWDYAKNRQLHYCVLIIASHFRQRCKESDTRSHSHQSSFTGTESKNGEHKPPRPPTTQPPEQSPKTPRRFVRKPEKEQRRKSSNTNSLDNLQNPVFNFDVASDSMNYAFDRKESEDLEYIPDQGSIDPLNFSGRDLPHSPADPLPARDTYGPPPKTARGRNRNPRRERDTQPSTTADVLSIEDDPPRLSSPQYHQSKQNTHLLRSQPPPMLSNHPLGKSPPSSHHDPPSRSPIPQPGQRRGELQHDTEPRILREEHQEQPPITPPEVRRKPNFPAQLMPLGVLGMNGVSSSGSRRAGSAGSAGSGGSGGSRQGRKKNKTSRGKRRSEHHELDDDWSRGEEEPFYVEHPISPPEPLSPKSNDAQFSLPNGGVPPNYTRPLQPPGRIAQSPSHKETKRNAAQSRGRAGPISQKQLSGISMSTGPLPPAARIPGSRQGLNNPLTYPSSSQQDYTQANHHNASSKTPRTPRRGSSEDQQLIECAQLDALLAPGEMGGMTSPRRGGKKETLLSPRGLTTRESQPATPRIASGTEGRRAKSQDTRSNNLPKTISSGNHKSPRQLSPALKGNGSLLSLSNNSSPSKNSSYILRK